VKDIQLRGSEMDGNRQLLGKLGLLEINGYNYEKSLGGGSALSSLYVKGGEKVVFKFLIAQRNDIELERFKLEYSVLEKNKLNYVQGGEGLSVEQLFHGPIESYPLPYIVEPLTHKISNMVSYFGYKYEEGVLLSDLDTSEYTMESKVALLYRLASALNYFNLTGYSHRDLHKENILLLSEPDMCKFDRDTTDNNPKIKFLDMGNCQRMDNAHGFYIPILRNLDEEAVFKDNNRRCLASFVSMPPDFLEKGKDIENYDTWGIGVYAYELLFGELPFDANEISDITSLRNHRQFSANYQTNLNSVSLGLKLILNHLLSPKGEERPKLEAIVRLFSWLVHRKEEFIDRKFINQVIHGEGFDPNHDPRDDYY